MIDKETANKIHGVFDKTFADVAKLHDEEMLMAKQLADAHWQFGRDLLRLANAAIGHMPEDAAERMILGIEAAYDQLSEGVMQVHRQGNEE